MPQVLCKDGTSRRTGTVPRGVSVPVGGAAQDARGRCASMHWELPCHREFPHFQEVELKFEKSISFTSRWSFVQTGVKQQPDGPVMRGGMQPPRLS